ncbi:metabotropic glutamate receptor 8-like isoform X1 [Labeo rohita]|uniref:Metabotropic glutamate receptor 8-like isoform X1 n=1 Tax=Labeo rohita TaxID=84645 RepID=A0A498NN10_LABRO|nr:metabotropic glutamate receptor 8-like isoform X1 [Labeo rohita]
MEVDKYILTEALSAILGVTVKLQSDLNGLDGVIQLHITSLTTLAFLGYEEFALVVQPVLHLTFLLTRLFVGEEQKSQETQTSESASSSLRKKIFAIPDDFFDPKFDFDFTNMSESKSDKCARGGEPYKRPYGWMRFALKVRNKYPDGNAWLGTRGWRSRSVPGKAMLLLHFANSIAVILVSSWSSQLLIYISIP